MVLCKCFWMFYFECRKLKWDINVYNLGREFKRQFKNRISQLHFYFNLIYHKLATLTQTSVKHGTDSLSKHWFSNVLTFWLGNFRQFLATIFDFMIYLAGLFLVVKFQYISCRISQTLFVLTMSREWIEFDNPLYFGKRFT